MGTKRQLAFLPILLPPVPICQTTSGHIPDQPAEEEEGMAVMVTDFQIESHMTSGNIFSHTG